MRLAWDYLCESIRSHPFNFFTLLFSLTAVVVAGWAAWEAHLTRTGADTAARAQARDLERSRVAAEGSANAAANFGVGTGVTFPAIIV